MKKSKTSEVTKVKLPRGRRLVGLLAVVALVAGLGVYTLISSFATTAEIDIVVTDAKTGKAIPGVGVVLGSGTAQTPPCASGEGATTDASGIARFTGCDVYVAPVNGVYYISAIDSISKGMSVAPNSPKRPGNDANGQVTTAPGYQAKWPVTLVPIDTDNDGTPNNAYGYPQDKCPNVAGPASNGGCPLPAPTPTPTPTPSSPAPTTSNPTKTTTPSKPKSSTTTKKTTTPKATAPAVVVATSGDTAPPSSPENFTISQADGSLFLSWDDASDNVGVTGYNIDRSTDGENWETVALNVSDAFYSDQDVNPGEHYYYRVQAVDASGNLSEGALGDISLTAFKSEVSENKKVAPAAKKSNTGLVTAVVSIILLILAGIVIAFLALRRRMSGSNNDPYSYDVSSLPGMNVPAATVMPNDHSQPLYNVGQPAQHTSVSLKDMVMEDMQKHGQGQPPAPPMIPPAPHQ